MKRFLIILFVFTSCGPLYKVSTEKNSGIPFIKQVVVETETLTYRESFFRIELSREYEKVEKDETAKSKTSNRIGTSKTKTNKNNNTSTSTEAKKTFKTTIVRFGTLDCGFEINSKFNSATTIEQAEKAIYDPLIGMPSTPNIGSNCTFKDKIFDYLTISEVINQIGTISNDNKALKLSLISNYKCSKSSVFRKHIKYRIRIPREYT